MIGNKTRIGIFYFQLSTFQVQNRFACLILLNFDKTDESQLLPLAATRSISKAAADLIRIGFHIFIRIGFHISSELDFTFFYQNWILPFIRISMSIKIQFVQRV